MNCLSQVSTDADGASTYTAQNSATPSPQQHPVLVPTPLKLLLFSFVIGGEDAQWRKGVPTNPRCSAHIYGIAYDPASSPHGLTLRISSLSKPTPIQSTHVVSAARSRAILQRHTDQQPNQQAFLIISQCKLSGGPKLLARVTHRTPCQQFYLQERCKYTQHP